MVRGLRPQSRFQTYPPVLVFSLSLGVLALGTCPQSQFHSSPSVSVFGLGNPHLQSAFQSNLVFSLSLVHNASIQYAAPMPGNMMTLPVLGACVSALLYFHGFERPELSSLAIPLPSPHDVVVQCMPDGTIAALLDEYDSDGE